MPAYEKYATIRWHMLSYVVPFHSYFIIRNCLSRRPVVENDVKWWKIYPKLQKVVFLGFSKCCDSNICNLNEIVVVGFMS